jgi:tetratricopeptide (TPR) repeat protein
LSVETLASLRALSVADLTAEQALPLADLLYTTGYLDIAGPLYGWAVERMDPNSPLFPENRAWALFQWGNCLRDTDPAGAIAAYQRLTVDYPQAPWTPMAKAWQDLADWYWREEPVRTLQEVTQPAPRTAEATTQDNGDAQS